MELTITAMLHFISGVLAIFSGFLAISSRKGRTFHRRCGAVFVFTMLIMSSSGVLLAIERNVMISLLVGLLTIYLVLTAWMSVGQRLQRYTWFSYILTTYCFIIAVAAIYYGLEASDSPDGTYDGFSYTPYFIFAGIAAFAGFLDLLMLSNGGLHGKHKTARHLWRMLVPLYIATTSLFEGPGVKVFPEAIQDSWLLSMPGLVVILMLIFSLISVLMPKPKFLKRKVSEELNH